MRNLIILVLIIGVLTGIGSRNEKTSASPVSEDADAKKEVVEKAEYFLEEAYDGFAICVSKCKGFLSKLIS